MQTRTYFASSVPAALEVARRELGEDALLLNSKVASAAAKPFGRLEVTFAYSPQPSAAAPSSNPGSQAQTISEMEEIRREISALKMMAGHSSHTHSEGPLPGEARLLVAGVEPVLARELAAAAARRGGSGGLMDEIMSRVKQEPFGELNATRCRTLAFVGPPGRGKTTSLVKLAFQYALSRRIPVRIYSAGCHGVGCREQMARYATILGIPFDACESLDSLQMALNGVSWKGLILIDTPGISPADKSEMGEWSRFFGRRPEIERHLTLRADANSADMLRVVERFSAHGPNHLLFTGLDEAAGYGAMLTTLIKSGLQAVFSGTGKQIPEDLEELNVAALVRAVCGERVMTTAAAA